MLWCMLGCSCRWNDNMSMCPGYQPQLMSSEASLLRQDHACGYALCVHGSARSGAAAAWTATNSASGYHRNMEGRGAHPYHCTHAAAGVLLRDTTCCPCCITQQSRLD
jgi:hypothetical protein